MREPDILLAAHRFLGLRRVALAGASTRAGHFSRMVLRAWREAGYEVVPVHPVAREVDGLKAFPSVAAIDPPVEGVIVLTPPAVAEAVVREAAAAGVRHAWLHRGAGEGTATREAVAAAREAKMDAVTGACPLMYLRGTGLIHRVHRRLRHGLGSLPEAPRPGGP
jgi:predicted CoA-binding protein